MRSLTLGVVVLAAAALLVPVSTAGAVPPPVPCFNKVGRSDFNGDGFDDAVVADPDATIAGEEYAGAVHVLYGDDDRIGGGERVKLSQSSAQVLGVSQEHLRFGSTIAVGLVDGDNCLDLVVSTAFGEVFGVTPLDGIVQVIFGSPSGLGNDKPALALPLGEVENPDFDDMVRPSLDVVPRTTTENSTVAIGIPWAVVNGHPSAGAVSVVGFTTAGEIATTAQLTDESPGVPGGPGTSTSSGYAVALGKVAGDPARYDLIIGSPGRTFNGQYGAGSVSVVSDVHDPVGSGTLWTQNTFGVPGMAESGDAFGGVLDFLQVGNAGVLAVGNPEENVAGLLHSGAVQLFTSNGAGLVVGAQLSQNSAGIDDAAEELDGFGAAVSLSPRGIAGNGTHLAVGVPGEDYDSIADVGIVHVLPLDDLATGELYTQIGHSIPGQGEPNDHFGRSVAHVGGLHESALLVGIPNDHEYPTGMVVVIPFTGPKRGWVPTSGAESFGARLTGRIT